MFGRATIRLGIGPHSSFSHTLSFCANLRRLGVFVHYGFEFCLQFPSTLSQQISATIPWQSGGPNPHNNLFVGSSMAGTQRKFN